MDLAISSTKTRVFAGTKRPGGIYQATGWHYRINTTLSFSAPSRQYLNKPSRMYRRARKSTGRECDAHTLCGRHEQCLAINAHPPEKVKSAIAKTHRAKTRRLRGVFAL